MLNSDPYKSPVSQPTDPTVGDRPQSSQSKPIAAICIGCIGAPLGGILYSVGYLGIVAIAEETLVPPLSSQGNYGQFGLLLIVLGFWGFLLGSSFGLIPYLRFCLWLPAFLLLSIPMCAAIAFPQYNVTSASLVFLGGVAFVLAAVTNVVVRRLERTDATYAA